MYALVDCNNFYASCERLFRPDLYHKPIIVLSNNDGCVIARSNEAKALGLKMGEPYFKIKKFCKQNNIEVFSSNYALYGDLSRRVMSEIADAWPDIEIYSIDEAFLDLSALPTRDTFCLELQKKILRNTGIPTSIGVGTTKTLAKIANFIAKKELKTPVFNITDKYQWLDKIDVSDIWGIGRQWSKQLYQANIHTAGDLVRTDPHWIKNAFNVALQRTQMELSGRACMALDEEKTKKSIQASRSFGEMQTEYQPLAQELSRHCARAYASLRKQQSVTQHVTVYIQSNRFRLDLAQYNPSISVTLPRPTDDLRLITKASLSCLKKIYKPGMQYKKVGMMLTNLTNGSCKQLDLFCNEDEALEGKTNRLMQLVDDINGRFGRQSVRLASQGWDTACAMKSNMKSPNYTTAWTDLPVVNTGFSI